MLCKETMAVAPLLVALYDRVFVFRSWGEAARIRRPLYAGLAASWAILGGVILAAPRAGSAGVSSGVSPWTYLLNQTVIISQYLRLSIWPDRLVAFYGWPIELTIGDVLPFALFIVALAAAAIVVLVRRPAIGFLGAWFFITLAPASSIVPVATEVGAERRMYLPLLALVLLLVIGGDKGWRLLMTRIHATPGGWLLRIPAAVVLAVAGTLAATTAVRNRDYRSGLSLAQSVVDRRPTAIAYHILGEQLMAAARDADATGPLAEAVARGDSRAGYPLGVALLNLGKHDEALERLDAFVRTSQLPYRPVPRWLEPPRSDVVAARVLIGRVQATRRDWTRVEEQAEQVLKLAPGHSDARRMLAQALINRGMASISAGRIDEAVDAFRRATDADPSNAAARELLGLALKDRQAAAAAR
jgi:tetratricopeptide (TPR) repeat protein